MNSGNDDKKAKDGVSSGMEGSARLLALYHQGMSDSIMSKLGEEVMHVSFDHEIGDIVTLKAMIEVGGALKALPLTVLERSLQECPGGIQKHYMVTPVLPPEESGWSRGVETMQILMPGGGNTATYNEVQIVPYPAEAREYWQKSYDEREETRLEKRALMKKARERKEGE